MRDGGQPHGEKSAIIRDGSVISMGRRILGLVGAVAVCGPLVWAQIPSPRSMTELLEAYDHRQYDEVLSDLAGRAPRTAKDLLGEGFDDSMLLELDGATKRWIVAGGPALAAHRRLVAATLALEIAHSRRNVWLHERGPFVSWACALLRQPPAAAPSDAERLWYVASVAALEEVGGWQLLVTGKTAYTSWVGELQKHEAPSGHLEHALARFPDEPRLRLAQVEERDIETRGLGSLRHDVMNSGTIRSDEVEPATLAELKRRAADTRDQRDQASAATTLERLGRLPAIANGYAALSKYDAIRAEVELGFGYVAARLGSANAAVEHLGTVPNFTTDPLLLYFSHFIRGWALGRDHKGSDAIAAYRQALLLRPNDRATATLLSSELFLSDRVDQRLEAFQILDAANKTEPAADDVWTEFRQGDARRFPEFIRQLREALK